MVTSHWSPYNATVHGNAAIHFMENLKKIKGATKAREKEKRVKDEEDLCNIEGRLEFILSSGDGSFYSEASKDELLGLEKRRQVLLGEKEEFWRLKSRAVWLKGGDGNMIFFQAYACGCKMGNTIWGLSKGDVSMVESFDELSELGVEHFLSLFKAQEEASIAEIIRIVGFFPRFLEDVDNNMLMEEVSVEELGMVLQSFQKDKSLGPDGWSIEFYAGFNELLGSDLLGVVEESRRMGMIHNPFNATFIALIPKLDNPTSVNDFRLISLCNCIYKL